MASIAQIINQFFGYKNCDLLQTVGSTINITYNIKTNPLPAE